VLPEPAPPEPPAEPSPEYAATGGPPPTAAAESSSASPLGSASSTSEATLALAPRWLVHPNPQSKIVARRKIDDDVVLKTLVGADGQVQQVVVLHGIPNCDECTESAVEAARRYVYDPPALSGGARAVWTQVEIHFGRHR
jgi:outer membrane biosynthesis protein TonB